MGYKILGFILPLILSISVTSTFSNDVKLEISNKSYDTINRAVYGIYFLIPFTDWSQLRPCGEFFDEHTEYETSLSCSNREVFEKKPYNKAIKAMLPRCYVITTASPDVHKTDLFNYLSFTFFTHEGIVGFYDDSDRTIYIVENTDAAMVYRHEVQHYLLDLVDGDGNGKHDHSIWSKCEPPYYTPSTEAYGKAGIKQASSMIKKGMDIVKKTLFSRVGIVN